MPPHSSRTRQPLLAYAYLTPFAALALYGLLALGGWWTGRLLLIQPRSYDPALPANACLCLALIGIAPIALALGWRRTGLGLGLAASVLAWATLIQSPLGIDLGLDDLLVRHEKVVSGIGIARMPAALSFVLMFGGLLFTWLAAKPGDMRRPLLLALVGSLGAAYGLTGLAAYRTGLNGVDLWQQYAGLGPHTALLLIVLGNGAALTEDSVRRSITLLQAAGRGEESLRPAEVLTQNILSNRGRTIRPKTVNQKRYVDAVDKNTIVFGLTLCDP